MYYDPYDNTQLKAFRRDPTGRWSPIVEEEVNQTICSHEVALLGGVALAVSLTGLLILFI